MTVLLATCGDLPRGEPEVGGPWVVQRFVESVRTRGEVSVHVSDGRPTQRFDNRPGADGVRALGS